MIPRIYFHLILAEVSQNTLVKLDQSIKNGTKEILHLPPHTADGLLYSSNRNGGLGMPRLEVQIPSAIIRKLEALESSPDAVIEASFEFSRIDNKRTIKSLRNLKVLREIEEALKDSGGPRGADEGIGVDEIGIAMGWTDITQTSRPKPTNRYAAWREAEYRKWTKLQCQGIGIGYYGNDYASNSWTRTCFNIKQSRLINYCGAISTLRDAP
ncbi:uncharacterized protein LOC121288447 [Carcharodon carcharias]|uniref:uncharacterized protein LOC121288447 n=1 Tax=Carcharodon carcharias TaxID=13397 RepID=UPI001B7F3E03|nr:uncharacterized protein LOC121288447 [Carcharodon carcharias]